MVGSHPSNDPYNLFNSSRVEAGNAWSWFYYEWRNSYELHGRFVAIVRLKRPRHILFLLKLVIIILSSRLL